MSGQVQPCPGPQGLASSLQSTHSRKHGALCCDPSGKAGASDNLGQVSVSMFSANHYRAELGGGVGGWGVQEKDTVE